MAKLTPNIPYNDLGDSHQIAEFSASWVMESSESVSYLALSDFRPERCGSTVVRRASFGDIEALAGELPMLPLRSYRIGCEQGVVVVEAVVIDRRYRWVVALEPSIAVGVSELPMVPRQVIDRSEIRGFVDGDSSPKTLREGDSEKWGDRSVVVEGERSPRLLIRRQ
jgi:hypothetical protein